MSRPNHGQSFGQWLWSERTRRSLSRPDFAELIRRAARDDGEQNCGCDEKQVRRWETNKNRPRDDYVRWIASALKLPTEEVAARVRGVSPRPSERFLAPVEPADADYIESLLDTNRHLIGLEVVHGGNDVAPLAYRYVSELRRRLAVGAESESLDSELRSAAGTLVGTAAWMAHDADHQEQARQLSFEAEHLSRLAGDREIEILTLSNLALFHLMTNRPKEALGIARSVLPTPLTNYQRVVFQLRESRALARLGAESEAFRIAESAVNDFLDGPAQTASEWWWLRKPEINSHLAETYQYAGRYDLALPIWQSFDDASAPKWNGNSWAGVKFLRLARLLNTAVGVGDWETAESAISRLLPYLGEVRSGRTVAMLTTTARQLASLEVSSTLRDSGAHLLALLDSTE